MCCSQELHAPFTKVSTAGSLPMIVLRRDSVKSAYYCCFSRFRDVVNRPQSKLSRACAFLDRFDMLRHNGFNRIPLSWPLVPSLLHNSKLSNREQGSGRCCATVGPPVRKCPFVFLYCQPIQPRHEYIPCSLLVHLSCVWSLMTGF